MHGGFAGLHLISFADISAVALPPGPAVVVSDLQLGEATLADSQANDRPLPPALQGPHPAFAGHD